MSVTFEVTRDIRQVRTSCRRHAPSATHCAAVEGEDVIRAEISSLNVRPEGKGETEKEVLNVSRGYGRNRRDVILAYVRETRTHTNKALKGKGRLRTGIKKGRKKFGRTTGSNCLAEASEVGQRGGGKSRRNNRSEPFKG